MDALVLIPDISGFTTFVNQTEVEHSRHIIKELLELIIDADALGMTVAEIEGDAILFYKEAVPPMEAVLAQARAMFIDFHAHLKQYENRRICQCGACCSAHTLTLKVVAHRDVISFLEVKNFRKPYGPALIVAHRLLKNDIPQDEYLLLTDPFFADPPAALPAWVRFCTGEAHYDAIGRVGYQYVPLGVLHSEVPPPAPYTPFQRIANPVAVETVVDLPLMETYELVTNLDLRLRWNQDIDALHYDHERVNRVGTQHQCIVQGRQLDFETITADYGGDVVVYGEQVEEGRLVKAFAVFWVLSHHGAGTHVRVELHYHPLSFPGSLLAPLFRLGATRQVAQSIARFEAAAAALVVA